MNHMAWISEKERLAAIDDGTCGHGCAVGLGQKGAVWIMNAF